MRLGKTLDARSSGTIMADRDLEEDIGAIFKNNPLETRLIGGSLLAYFAVFKPLFQWMWMRAPDVVSGVTTTLVKEALG